MTEEPQVLVYARVSTSIQEDGTSLDTQVAACTEYAHSLGYTNEEQVRILRDTGSGADPDRAGLQDVWTLAETGRIDCIVAYVPDRIARDPVHIMMFRERVMELGVKLYFVNGPQDDSPESRLIEYMLGYVGHKERLAIAERTNRGKRQVAREGRLPIGTGAGLYGYDYNKETKSRQINEIEAAIVLLVFMWYAAGLTLSEIAHSLNEEGYRTKRGRLWGPEAVRRILKHEAYTGKTWYGKRRYQMKRGGRIERSEQPRSEWIDVGGFTPRIITDELFQQVQDMLAASSARRRNGAKQPSSFVLTGFIKCERCNRSVVGNNNQKGRWRYYRCRGANGRDDGTKLCDAKGIQAGALEELVWDEVVRLVEQPDLISQNLAQYVEGDSGGLKMESDRLRRKISQEREKEKRLTSLFGDGLIDQDLLREQVGTIAATRGHLEQELAALEQQQSMKKDQAELEKEVAAYCKELQSQLGADSYEEKRSVFAALDVKIVANKEEVTLNVSISPGFTTNSHTSA